MGCQRELGGGGKQDGDNLSGKSNTEESENSADILLDPSETDTKSPKADTQRRDKNLHRKQESYGPR